MLRSSDLSEPQILRIEVYIPDLESQIRRLNTAGTSNKAKVGARIRQIKKNGNVKDTALMKCRIENDRNFGILVVHRCIPDFIE